MDTTRMPDPKGREQMIRDGGWRPDQSYCPLKRRGLSRLSSLDPPHLRYEREKPGEIIHFDIKKLGRFNSVGHRIA
jgi:hypothetical protein